MIYSYGHVWVNTLGQGGNFQLLRTFIYVDTKTVLGTDLNIQRSELGFHEILPRDNQKQIICQT